MKTTGKDRTFNMVVGGVVVVCYSLRTVLPNEKKKDCHCHSSICAGFWRATLDFGFETGVTVGDRGSVGNSVGECRFVIIFVPGNFGTNKCWVFDLRQEWFIPRIARISFGTDLKIPMGLSVETPHRIFFLVPVSWVRSCQFVTQHFPRPWRPWHEQANALSALSPSSRTLFACARTASTSIGRYTTVYVLRTLRSVRPANTYTKQKQASVPTNVRPAALPPATVHSIQLGRHHESRLEYFFLTEF